MRLTRLPILLFACLPICLLAGSSAAGPPDLRFHAAADGGFDFNTGILSGKLRAGGKSVGLLPVVHVPTGITLTRSMGLVSHYRVFSANQRYGDGAWDWPSEAKLQEDGSIEVHWPAAAARPFEMWVLYRWDSPSTLDLETRVRSRVTLLAFESFLASYFSDQFSSSKVYATGAATGSAPAFLPAEESRGVWQIFPRDPQALALIQDGRWKIEPHPVDWAIRPTLAQPLALRRAEPSGITAVVMARPRDCFAVATPHQTEPHFSLYLSLFGRTIQAGETERARARLVVITSPTEEQIVEIYRAWRDDPRAR